MTSTNDDPIRCAAILFSGGPSPAANAVISTAAVSFLNPGIKVVGIKHGYSGLLKFDPDNRPLEAGKDYVDIDHAFLKRTRNSQGVMLGTARANPGEKVLRAEDLNNPECTAPLERVYLALRSLGVDALVSIGGDDTLTTANKLKRYQDSEHFRAKYSDVIRVVHVPKTIDNDYRGIDFTFGYFTAVEVLAGEIRNLLADAEANRSYFIAESMGRSAGWLAYGAAIAGEA
ncbi:MAG: 6-phosphofructokinase, partial [Planctomycetales bacterium]